jgi:hypothetical protein
MTNSTQIAVRRVATVDGKIINKAEAVCEADGLALALGEDGKHATATEYLDFGLGLQIVFHHRDQEVVYIVTK